MRRKSNGGVMAIVIIALVIGMFIVGGLFMAAITGNLNPEDVEDTPLADTTGVVTSIMELFVGLYPVLIGIGILALIVVTALILFRSAKRRR